MHRVNCRRGGALLEWMISCLIGAIIMASAYAGVIHLGRVSEAVVRREQGERLAAEVLGVLQAIGRHLRYPRVLGDTALHGEFRLGVGVACRAEEGAVTLAPTGAAASTALTMLMEPPTTGDRLEYFTASDSLGEGWTSVTVVGTRWLGAREGCEPESPLVARAHHDQVVVRVSIEGADRLPVPGAPVELFREVRVVPYDDGRLGWMLGVRGCAALDCGPVQPIAGPLRSPRDAGLRFEPLAPGEPVLASVRVPGLAVSYTGSVTRVPVAR